MQGTARMLVEQLLAFHAFAKYWVSLLLMWSQQEVVSHKKKNHSTQ
jgi:hypothetical protein